MIDHVLGRPSAKSRRLQVLAVISFWSAYLYRGHKHGPPGAQPISVFLSRRLTAWQTVLLTMIYLYAARNFSALVGLASPEPMANMYDTTYFRATWVLTALDAGFWTAMRIRVRWLRDIASIVFSIFYLFATERADEKVRKVRGMLTVDHLRVAWNKGTSPYLSVLQGLLRPRFTRWPPRQVRIPRPSTSDYKQPVSAWLYYDGPLADLSHHDRVIIDIPGGGFVAMDPRCNDDKLFAWAAKSGLPVLSLDYKKAPEFPYPYALNECFDVYTTMVQSRGRCIGMSGSTVPRLILTGDSAGGNLAVATTLMILETCTPHFRRFAGSVELPAPEGLVCFYPALDMNIGNWMSDEQMSLIRDRKMRKTNRSIVRRKSQQYNDLVGTPHHSDDDEESPQPRRPAEQAAVDGSGIVDDSVGMRSPHPEYSHGGPQSLSRPPSTGAPGAADRERSDSASHRVEPMKTRLATSSMISYTNDRVLTPEMMRAMIILYIGQHNRPDFSSDYLLSPVLAPDALLAKFPKTYFMTGERDPLVDDTVIFAGRLRRAKEAAARQETRGAGRDLDQVLEDLGSTEVTLIPGTSHGFMQFPAVYPPAWKHFNRCVEWFEDLFAHNDAVQSRRGRRRGTDARAGAPEGAKVNGAATHPEDGLTAESSGEEDAPLEMTRITRGSVSRDAGSGGEAAAAASPPPPPPKLNGDGKKGRRGGVNREQSFIKLNSEEDLLSRRMQGLTSGLTGGAEED